MNLLKTSAKLLINYPKKNHLISMKNDSFKNNKDERIDYKYEIGINLTKKDIRIKFIEL